MCRNNKLPHPRFLIKYEDNRRYLAVHSECRAERDGDIALSYFCSIAFTVQEDFRDRQQVLALNKILKSATISS
jgi:hypothetical protein